MQGAPKNFESENAFYVLELHFPVTIKGVHVISRHTRSQTYLTSSCWGHFLTCVYSIFDIVLHRSCKCFFKCILEHWGKVLSWLWVCPARSERGKGCKQSLFRTLPSYMIIAMSRKGCVLKPTCRYTHHRTTHNQQLPPQHSGWLAGLLCYMAMHFFWNHIFEPPTS